MEYNLFPIIEHRGCQSTFDWKIFVSINTTWNCGGSNSKIDLKQYIDDNTLNSNKK